MIESTDVFKDPTYKDNERILLLFRYKWNYRETVILKNLLKGKGRCNKDFVGKVNRAANPH